MTTKQLIRVLQKFDKQYPRKQVTINVWSRNKQADQDLSNRAITSVGYKSITQLDDDYSPAFKANGEERFFETIEIGIE